MTFKGPSHSQTLCDSMINPSVTYYQTLRMEELDPRHRQGKERTEHEELDKLGLVPPDLCQSCERLNCACVLLPLLRRYLMLFNIEVSLYTA